MALQDLWWSWDRHFVRASVQRASQPEADARVELPRIRDRRGHQEWSTRFLPSHFSSVDLPKTCPV